jgi:hypothetical protein
MSKTWRISHEDAERTLDNTTHLPQRTTNPELSRNYRTNDRMLRYKRIKDYFYVDTIKKDIIKIRSRQHEHTSQCDGPAWLTSERGAMNSWFPFIDGVSPPTTSR